MLVKKFYLSAALVTLALSALPGLAETRPQDEKPERIQTLTKTPLLALKERQNLTVAVAPLSEKQLPMRAVVRFVDENGRLVGVSRGRVGTRTAFTATLEHDALDRL